MSALHHGIGLALQRSAAVSRQSGSGNTTIGLALRRRARLSHPPPSVPSSRFLATCEPRNTRQLENSVEETKGELVNMYVRTHCKDSVGAPDAAKVKVEPNQAPTNFQGTRMGSANQERVSDECRSSTKQIVEEAAVSSGSGGRKYRDHKDYLDRVVAPVSFGLLLLHIFMTSRWY